MEVKEILTKLSRKTEAGELEWKIQEIDWRERRYQTTTSGGLEIIILYKNLTGGRNESTPRAKYSLQIRENDETLLKDDFEWDADTDSKDLKRGCEEIQDLVAFIDEKVKEQEEAAEKSKKEERIEYILKKI